MACEEEIQRIIGDEDKTKKIISIFLKIFKILTIYSVVLLCLDSKINFLVN